MKISSRPETKSGRKQDPAFTLIELLVVIATIGILASLLLPALSKARQKGQMAKCLNNLHQISLGMRLYVDESGDTFPPAALSQVDKTVPWNSPKDVYYGNSLGGKDVPGTISATNRLLNPYVPTSEAWHCPADRGFGSRIKPTGFDSFGNSYRFNWVLENDYADGGGIDDPIYNLGLKKENWVPDPGRFIVMHEFAAYPWNNGGEVAVTSGMMLCIPARCLMRTP
jgi:prepilin-type N-terminal cleavage/methylation domain-containing protein